MLVDVQTATVVIAGISVIIGVINSILSSRRAEQQRQTQLFMQLYNRWNTKEVAKQYGNVRYRLKLQSYEDWSKLMGGREGIFENIEDYSDYQSLSEFFEGVGVLVKRRLIDVNLVEDLLANRILWWWEMWRPISEGARKGTGDPKLHDHTEYLYNIMKKRQQQAVTST